MDSNSIILLLCGLVITSYLFEIFSKKTGIPSVLFLIALGVLLNKLTVFYEIPAVDFLRLIPVIGTVGLILIVFEGALEIEYHSDKKMILFKVLAVSIIILAANSVIMASIFRHFTGLGFHQCFVNAIPLSVISSAIAIPSAAHLSAGNKEFITMESSLSDILGIILFNYAVINSTLTFFLTGKIIIVTVVSFIFCLILLYLLRSIGHNIKFVLILSVMVFLYSLGKSIHVSSLILVLMFGLLLKNINLIKSGFINKHFNNLKYINEFNFMQQINSEGVFLVKTFFFIIFGFILTPESLLSPVNIITASAIIATIYVVRLISLLTVRQSVFPGIFYAPRGLITILLYSSIPAALQMNRINIDVLFIVILATSTIMILGSSWRRGAAESCGDI
jgi:Kef-type K+ transport system membrane component KefB